MICTSNEAATARTYSLVCPRINKQDSEVLVMASFLASSNFAILDPPITLPASLTTRLIDYYARTTEQVSEQDATLAECRYRLDNSTSSTVTLSDSRTLGYAQYGSLSPTAHTFFYVHDWPASRVEGTFLDSAAKRHNISITTWYAAGLFRGQVYRDTGYT